MGDFEEVWRLWETVGDRLASEATMALSSHLHEIVGVVLDAPIFDIQG